MPSNTKSPLEQGLAAALKEVVTLPDDSEHKVKFERHDRRSGQTKITWYLEVDKRVDIVRRCLGPHIGIETALLLDDGQRVMMRAVISDAAGRVLAVGHAEEIRGRGVNAAAAIENCETSAVGRALAFLGLAGGSIASAEELVTASPVVATAPLAGSRSAAPAQPAAASSATAPVAAPAPGPAAGAPQPIAQAVPESEGLTITHEIVAGIEGCTTIDQLNAYWSSRGAELDWLRQHHDGFFAVVHDRWMARASEIQQGG